MSSKFTEKLCFMTMKNDAKFEEKLTCHFKIDMRNLMNFDTRTRTFKKFAIYWTSLTKEYNVRAKNIQMGYV